MRTLWLSLLLAAAAGLDVTLTQQWATPIFSTSIPDAAELNEMLLTEAAALRAAAQGRSGRRRSDRGGWRSESDLHRRRRYLPGCAQLVQHIEAMAAAALERGWRETPHASGKLEVDISAMWLMLLGPGASVVPHKHGGALLAGIYWVNAPAALLGGTGSDARALKFHDPRVQAGVLPGTEWMAMGSEVMNRPHEGQMLLWPGWLEHHVEPTAIDSRN